MSITPEKFKGKYRTTSHRLRGYDYSQEGAYFITICCANRACLFGEIVDGKMQLNDLGKQTEIFWKNIPDHFLDAVVDEYVVMPDHIHGIVFLFPSVETKNFLSLQKPNPQTQKIHGTSRTIGSIVRGFKIGVTKYVCKNTETPKVWQQNYYDHIIKNEDELNRIRQYILENPAKWNDDISRSENIYF